MVIGSAVVVFCLVCLLAVVLRESDGAGDADIARMKRNLLAYWIGAEADRDDPMVIASLRGVEQAAGAALEAMGSDGGRGDIDYEAQSGREFRVARHVSRVAAMAEGFRTPGQSRCGDPGLVGAVEQSLSVAHDLVGDDWPTSGGWWQQQIHIPRKLGETLLLMEGSLSPGAVAQTKSTMRYLLMEDAPRGRNVIWHVTLLPPDAPPGEAQRATGENMVWLAQNHLYLALLDTDVRNVELVQAAIAGQCAVQSGATRQPFNEGIKEDYSFQQHGPLLYTGGYGRSFFEDVPQYIWAARGTRYQIPAAGIEVFAHYVLDSSVWCIYENYYDPSCRGREIARPEKGPMEAPLALLVLANVANPRRDEAISAARSFHQVNPSYQLRTAPLWAAIRDSPIAASAPLGHRHFWESDYTVHRGQGYFASLRMFSDRTRPAECINAEGKTSWHQANGLLWVFLRGGGYAADDVLPTLDWLRLPGTTVERKRLEPAEGIEGWPPPMGHRAFVGGAFTEDRGTSAMELAAMVPPLTAKKSWFFFGGEIVCLGSDIDCPSDDSAETIVNQWPLSDPGALLTVDGQAKPSSMTWSEDLESIGWAHCDGIGYCFPKSQRLKAKREVQRGSWHDMSDSRSAAVHSNPFLTLWFDHGVQAKGAAYAYAVLPGASAAQTEAYAASNPITILAHDSRAHAVRQNARGAVGVVFWAPGSVGKLSADRACIAFYEEIADGVALAVSDPTHEDSTFHVTIGEPLTPTQCSSEMSSEIVDGKTIITCRAEKGRNYRAHFARRQ
ncbi:MAG: polysaccharide lyase 8 family protein [Armatimonadota bacterium]